MKTHFDSQILISQMIDDAEKELSEVTKKLNSLSVSPHTTELEFILALAEQNRFIGKVNGLKAAWEALYNA